jgi:hypothetical protein
MLSNGNPTTSVNITKDKRTAKIPTVVSANATPSIALPANEARNAYSIYNRGPSSVFMQEGTTVTSSLWEVQIHSGFYWKEDFPGARYLGPISVVTAANGNAVLQVSESVTLL